MITQEDRIQSVRQKIAKVKTKLADNQILIDDMEKRFGKNDLRAI